MNNYNILLFFINFIIKANSQSHAFIQVDNELKYLVDGVPVSMGEVLHSGENEQGLNAIYDERIITKNYLIFDPPFLDFKEHPTGMPLTKKVFIQNSSPDVSIHLHSLSGNTMHFHCTFFHDKMINPNGNTSFDVVFLGREEGFIENTIYVHTSVGTYRYWVKAIGAANPYRVRPLIGVRMPLNSSYTPILQVHNPHNQHLQIVEMYSTGGDLHLELTNSEANGQNWSVAPYQTKALMKATFVARRENNHTAYIRIVPKKPINDYVVIPVEVEVSGEQGLFFPLDTLHFGLLTPHDPPVSLPLYLLNSAPKHIHIQNIITSTVNEAISIDFKQVKIPPGTVHPVKVATVTFDPSKVNSGVKVSGKLLIKSKVSAYKLSVPFSVDLHRGSLIYNCSVTRFYSGSGPVINSTLEKLVQMPFDSASSSIPSSLLESGPVYQDLNDEAHDLILKNTFKFPVVVYNISVPEEASPHFKVMWNGPVIIREGRSKKVAELSLVSIHSDVRHTVQITVHTNVTSINIPLIAYNGKLTKYVPPSGKDSWLDFGTLGMGEQHNNYFYIMNENPVDIRLKGWGSTLSQSAVELMGIVKGNFSNIPRNPNKTYANKSLFLKPNHYAVFRIGILTPHSEGIFNAESFVHTQYEIITIPFRLRTADGILSIFPDAVALHNSFPGKISEQDLYILSTFSHSMMVEGISPRSMEPQFSYIPPDSCSGQPVLHPNVRSHIGMIIFDPKASCSDECYTGFSLDSKVGQQWAGTFPLTSHAVEVDGSLLSTHRYRFEKLDSISYNMSLFLDTSEVKGHQFNAKVNLIWPKFATIQEVRFPLTQVFNTSYKDLTVANPASESVVAQVLFLHDYPSPHSILPILHDQLNFEKNISWSDESFNSEPLSEVFSFLDKGSLCKMEENAPCNSEDVSESSLSSTIERYRRSFESDYKTRVAKDSLVLLLEANSVVKVRLSFTPFDEKYYSTLILIRNNLTVVEAVSITGSGGRGRINFRKTPHFSIQEKNLKNCTLPARLSTEQSSMYTLRQTFFAENNGLLPVHIYGLSIGDSPCQSYGFKVINCSSFLLMPNQSHKIEIAFTPDFSLFHVEQLLVVSTSLNGISSSSWRKRDNITIDKRDNVTIDPNGNLYLKLIATVSPHAVARCSEKIPRPPWEPLLYYALVIMLVAMFVGTLLRAYLECEHILKSTFVPMTTAVPVNEPVPVFDRGKVFDLQAISLQQSAEAIINDSTSDSSHCENNNNNNSKCSNNLSYIKIKNHINTVKNNSNKKSSASLHKSNVTLNKSKKIYSSEDSNNFDQSPTSWHNRKSSDYKKNNLKMNLSSFLSSLPFGLKNHPQKSHHDYVRSRKDSQKENEQPTSSKKNVDNDEFSSTTTESSSIDDICAYLKDNYMSPYEEKLSQRKKNAKSSSITLNNSESCFPIKTPSSQDADTGFEITTKCKGIKKIKEMNSKKNYNTLELPYTLKSNKITDFEDEKKTKHKISNKRQQKNNADQISSPLDRKNDESMSNSSPKLKTPARAIIAPSTRPLPPPSNQPLAPRDPSYSSILLGNTKQKAKVTPVGKILPEVKHVEKPLGAIGQKIPTNPNGNYLSGIKPLMGLPSPIVTPAASYSSADPINNLYMSNMQGPPQQAVSSHSWDPKTLSSPSLSGFSLDMLRSPPANTMSDDDWLPFGGPSFSVWSNEGDSLLRDKPSPPAPTLWESFPSFSIWSSPWGNNQSPMSSSIILPSRNPQWQPSSTYDANSVLSHTYDSQDPNSDNAQLYDGKNT